MADIKDVCTAELTKKYLASVVHLISVKRDLKTNYPWYRKAGLSFHEAKQLLKDLQALVSLFGTELRTRSDLNTSQDVKDIIKELKSNG